MIDKTDKQVALAEHKKANDAYRKIKTFVMAVVRNELHAKVIIVSGNGSVQEVNIEPDSGGILLDRNETILALATVSEYLSNQFKAIMKSNNKKVQSTFRPIRVKNLPKENEMKAKKPVKKVTKKVTKKARKTTTKRTSK